MNLKKELASLRHQQMMFKWGIRQAQFGSQLAFKWTLSWANVVTWAKLLLFFENLFSQTAPYYEWWSPTLTQYFLPKFWLFHTRDFYIFLYLSLILSKNVTLCISVQQSGFSNNRIKCDDSCGLFAHVARQLSIKLPTQSRWSRLACSFKLLLNNT